MPRKLPIGLREATKRELQKMGSLGVIEKVDEYKEWCAGMEVVHSKDQWRCENLCRFDKIKQKCQQGKLSIAEGRRDFTLKGNRIFSKMDANSGFWQIELEKSRKCTTFIPSFGRFQFCKMSLGISAAPGFLQRQITKLLNELNGVACLMDDRLIYGKKQYELDKRLEEVMKRLEEAGITLNRSVFSLRTR